MKNKSIKKFVSAMLITTMAASMVVGCGSKDDTTTDAPADDATTEDNAGDSADDTADNTADGDYTDYSGGFPETVTIQIPVYDRAFEGWDVTDNYYTQWIQSEFGDKYNVNVEYVAIGRQTEIQDYMQMIAAGTAPNIIMHYDMPQAVNYYGEGAMQPLDLDEIAYYAPTYYDKMADTIAKYGSLDGENVFFFAEREAIYYNWVTLIRQDWLDQVGADMPTNLEELNAVAAKWKEAGLGTLGGELPVASFTMEYPFFNDSYTDEDYAKYLDLNVAPLTWEPTKEYLKNLNTQFHEGLVDPEWYLNTDDASKKADFVSGNCGTYSFYINSSTDAIASLLANDPDAKVSCLHFGALSENGNYYYYEYPPYGMIMGVNSTTTDEQRAALWMFLDWMSQPENLFYLQNGVEGENYTLNENGVAIQNSDFDGESKLSQNNNKDYWCLVQEVVTYDTEEGTYQYNLSNLAPNGYEYLIEDAYKGAQDSVDYGIVTPIFTKAVEATSEYSGDLNALWQEACAELGTCDPAEFDAKYEEYCQKYLDAGYQEILDEKQSYIDEGSFIL